MRAQKSPKISWLLVLSGHLNTCEQLGYLQLCCQIICESLVRGPVLLSNEDCQVYCCYLETPVLLLVLGTSTDATDPSRPPGFGLSLLQQFSFIRSPSILEGSLTACLRVSFCFPRSVHLQICFPPLIKFLYDNKVWLAFVPEDGNNLHNLLIVSQTKKKKAFVSILNCNSIFLFFFTKSNTCPMPFCVCCFLPCCCFYKRFHHGNNQLCTFSPTPALLLHTPTPHHPGNFLISVKWCLDEM